MAETSRPWDGTTVGDATVAPYDAGTEWAEVHRALSPASEQSAHKGGAINGISGFNGYLTTSPGLNTQRVQTGIGFVQGTWHRSDANVDVTIPTPAVSTRIDRIVLRKSWAAQTVRITRIAGTEGAGVPALTQTFGTTWDVPLYQVSITVAGPGTMTLTDERVFILVPTHAHTGATDGGALSGGLSDPVITGQVFVTTGVVTLPPVAANAGRWRFYKATTAQITVTPTGGEALWPPGATAASGTNVTYIQPAGESVGWYCNGTNWIAI